MGMTMEIAAAVARPGRGFCGSREREREADSEEGIEGVQSALETE